MVKKKVIHILLLSLTILTVLGCEDEKMEGTLVISLNQVPANSVSDPMVYIYSIANLDHEVEILHLPKNSKTGKITLNVGDYVAWPRWLQPNGVPYNKTGFQIRQGETTVVEY